MKAAAILPARLNSTRLARKMLLAETGRTLIEHSARNALASGAGASTGRSLLDAVLKGGAACLDQPMGAIAVGRRCDIAVLDEMHPAMIGRSGDAALDTWIFSAGNAAVKDVIVGGSHVVKDRRHMDEDRIQKKFTETVRRLS